MSIVSDRALAIWGFIFGLIGLGIGGFSIWFGFIASPWGTRNDYFCYEVEGGKSCYYTRANCETEQRRGPLKVIRECEREEKPFK